MAGVGLQHLDGISVAAADLLFKLFDAMALISIDLPEQRRMSVKAQMGDGDEVRGFRLRAADVQTTHDASFFPSVEDAHDATAGGNRSIGRLFSQRSNEGLREPGFHGQRCFHLYNEATGLFGIVDHQ